MPEWDPKDYEKNSCAQEKWAKEIIEKLGLRGDEHILDIGCGDGKVSAELARHAPKGRVAGLDSSGEMIGYASAKYRGCANLRFEKGDASSLRYEGEYDLVVSFACLHWVKDHRPVLEGIRRSLRPNGRTVLQFGGKGNAEDLVKAAEDVIAGNWGGYFKEFTFPWTFYAAEEYRALIEQSGLKPLRVELIPKDREDLGKEGIASFIRTAWHPYTSRIPEDMRNKFIDEVAEEYLRRYPLDSKGVAHTRMVRLEAEARLTL